MQHRLYRKAALEKLSSPEQLDMLMQVTTPKGWLSLFAIGSIILITVVWSILGSIPTKVQGQGILVKKGGIYDIVPLASGQLVELSVNEGDYVEEDQVVARIAQPKLIEEINKARARLDELKTQFEEKKHFTQKEMKLNEEFRKKQSVNLKFSIQVSQERLKWLTEKITVQEKLLAQGLITRQTLLNTKQSYYSTKEEIERIRNELNQISIKRLAEKNRTQQEMLNGQIQINEAERSLRQLERELELSSKVVSPYSGRILEVLADEGNVVNIGYPILRIELNGDKSENLEAVVFVSPGEGKKIQPGMQIQIEPSTVKRQEFGFILGKVIQVAEFPSTPQGMMKVLKNKQLVAEWAKEGAPFEVHAELVRDPNSESGYKWSSKGPPGKIYSGTICNSSIIVREQKPISMVIPLIKEYTGI